MSDVAFYGADARERVLGGAKELYEAVKTTMGPKGRNVVISKGFPIVTHDGVTVAKSYDVKDVPVGRKTGADLIKEAASKMNDTAGDGTTTVTVLTYHLLNEANKLIAAGYSPMELRTELEEAAQVVEKLEGENIEGDVKRMSQIAYISCGDEVLGKLVADTVYEIGKDGVVTVEASQELGTTKEVVNGFTFDKGMFSPYFAIDQGRQEAELKTPAILVVSGKIYDIQELLPILEQLQKANKPLVLFAEEFAADVIANLLLNKVKGSFLSCCVSVTKEQLTDISVTTGGAIFGIDTGKELSTFAMDDLGGAEKVIVSQKDTTIVDGYGDISEAVKALQKAYKDAPSEYEKEEHLRHKAALQGKVAIIKVGGTTETEMEEKKFRVDDAVHAVKAALEEGIVGGGGITLINLADMIADRQTDTNGSVILRKALLQPFLILCENAGIEGKVYLAGEVRNPRQGINVRTGETVDLMKEGIVDPAKVTRQAVQQAVSVAGTAMTMGALIVREPEEEKPQQMIIPGN